MLIRHVVYEDHLGGSCHALMEIYDAASGIPGMEQACTSPPTRMPDTPRCPNELAIKLCEE
jgi:hypothetical protein